MAHSHHHTSLEPCHPYSATVAFAVALSLNLGFTIIEFVCAWWSNSVSLMGDAGHNFTDVLGLGFAWLANWLLTKGSSEKFSYGLKRTTILAAFFNALILMMTSLFIAYESIQRIINPVALSEQIMIAVALIGILVNGGTAILFIKGRHNDLNIRGAFLHLMYDALISVGVVIAGVIIAYTGFSLLDPIMGLLIVLTIVFGTWSLLRDSVNLLLDAVPTKIDQQGVTDYLQNISGVSGVHDLHIWGLSTRHIALTAHLIMPNRYLSDEEYIQINNELKEKYHIDHVTLQIEKGLKPELCQQNPDCCQ